MDEEKLNYCPYCGEIIIFKEEKWRWHPIPCEVCRKAWVNAKTTEQIAEIFSNRQIENVLRKEKEKALIFIEELMESNRLLNKKIEFLEYKNKRIGFVISIAQEVIDEKDKALK